MCILAVIMGVRPDVPLVMVHSRDEQLDRPVHAPVHDGQLTIAKDVRDGGAWLAYSAQSGVVVALTNVRTAAAGKPEGAVSRGQLVLAVARGSSGLSFDDLLGASTSAAAPAVVPGGDLPCLSPPIPVGAPYAPFNLVAARVGAARAPPSAVYTTNVDPSTRQPLPLTVAGVLRLGDGVHVVSNSSINDASWRKVQFMRVGLQEAISGLPTLGECCVREQGAQPAEDAGAGEPALVEALLGAIPPVMSRDTPLAPGAGVGGTAWSPLPPAVEEHLQAHVFLHPTQGPGCPGAGGSAYGTRSLTVLAHVGGHVYLAHRSYDPDALASRSSGAAVASAASAAAARRRRSRAQAGARAASGTQTRAPRMPRRSTGRWGRWRRRCPAARPRSWCSAPGMTGRGSSSGPCTGTAYPGPEVERRHDVEGVGRTVGRAEAVTSGAVAGETRH